MFESDSLVSTNYFLKPGHIFVSTKPTIISTVLGSCVSVYIYDTNRIVVGMNHFMLPYIREKDKTTAVYGNVATMTLIRMMIYDGSKSKDLEAQIFGGAYNPKISHKDIGRENIIIAKKILEKKRIRVVSEDMGGEKGRKIVVNTSTNEVAAIKVERLRKGDWYPYENDR